MFTVTVVRKGNQVPIRVRTEGYRAASAIADRNVNSPDMRLITIRDDNGMVHFRHTV